MDFNDKNFHIPNGLADVLSSLGISGIPSSWNLNVTESSYSLNLLWHRDNARERNNKDGKILCKYSDSKDKKDFTFGDENAEEIDVLTFKNGEHMAYSESAVKSFLNQRRINDEISTDSEMYKKGNNVYENSIFTDQNTENGRKCKESGILHENQIGELEEAHHEGEYQPSPSNSNFGDNSLVYNGLHDNSRFHGSKATCSCGGQFIFKERAIKHILFSCPVSLCFRVDLDLRIHDVIDKWQDEEQRILGRKWWHSYKTSGVPDIMGTYPVTSVDDLEGIINNFIAKAGTNELLDQNQNRFVLMKGLEELPYELVALIG